MDRFVYCTHIVAFVCAGGRARQLVLWWGRQGKARREVWTASMSPGFGDWGKAHGNGDEDGRLM